MNIFSQMAGSWMRPLRSFFGAALLLGVALTANAGSLTLSGCSSATSFTTYTINVDINGNGTVNCVTPASASTPSCTLGVATIPSPLYTAGGTVTLTASCTGPTPPTSYTWAVAAGSPVETPPVPGPGPTNSVIITFPSTLPAAWYSYTVTTDTVSAPAPASVFVNAPPSTTPAPIGLPANCRMGDFQTLTGYGAGDQTFNPNGTARPRIVQPANEIRAYRLLRSSLPVVGTNGKFGGFNIGAYTMTIHLSSSPCDFEPEVTASKFTDYCQIYNGGAGSFRTYYLPNDPNLSNATFGATPQAIITNLQACILPPADAQGYVYINTRLASHATGGPVSPTSSTCVAGVEPSAPTSCTHYVFYK